MPDGFAGRYEVLEDRGAGRRTWPADVKLRIVAESHAPGVMVSEVARRHRLMPSQVTTWRRLYREGKLGPAPVAASPMFVPLMLEVPERSRAALDSTAGPEPRGAELIEIEAGGGVVTRLGASTPAVRIAEIAAALREGRP
jgi:transposase